ncbi:MAG: hypothetical protein JSV64_02650, partial [Candidatus Bathyarchaeota archaeon]
PRDFGKILLEAIDEGLSSLGQSSRQAIYFHLEKSFNIKKQEIPLRLEVFTGAIEQIFGSGADYLEILIVNRLNEKIGKPRANSVKKEGCRSFSEYIGQLKEECKNCRTRSCKSQRKA